MPLQGSGWPTGGFSFMDTFEVISTVTFTYSPRQSAPHNDGGSNVRKSSGTGTNYDALDRLTGMAPMSRLQVESTPPLTPTAPPAT